MEYYNNILVCVDDLFDVFINMLELLKNIQGIFKFKNNNIYNHSYYLGARLEQK